MGTAIAVRAEYTSKQLRGLAARVKSAAQARRLLAIAAVLDGHSRAAAAEIGGMDRQTLRDWVIRFNAQGPDGLVNTLAGRAQQAFRRAQGASGPDR
jgi:transposase